MASTGWAFGFGERSRSGGPQRSARESGLPNIEMVENSILDLDIHYIPANSKEVGHFHYDVRFLFAATGSNAYILSEESNALAWVGMEQVSSYTREALFENDLKQRA